MNWLGTNTTSISARASMDFPLQGKQMLLAAITRTLLMILSYYMHLHFINQWF
jgi:hypothetical protein